MLYDMSLTRVVAATELAVGEVVSVADLPVGKFDPAGLVQATARSDASRGLPARPGVAPVLVSAVAEESNGVAVVSVEIGTRGDVLSAVSTTVQIQSVVGSIKACVIELCIDAAVDHITSAGFESVSLRKSFSVRPGSNRAVLNLGMGCLASFVVGNKVSALRSALGDEKATSLG